MAGGKGGTKGSKTGKKGQGGTSSRGSSSSSKKRGGALASWEYLGIVLLGVTLAGRFTAKELEAEKKRGDKEEGLLRKLANMLGTTIQGALSALAAFVLLREKGKIRITSQPGAFLLGVFAHGAGSLLDLLPFSGEATEGIGSAAGRPASLSLTSPRDLEEQLHALRSQLGHLGQMLQGQQGTAETVSQGWTRGPAIGAVEDGEEVMEIDAETLIGMLQEAQDVEVDDMSAEDIIAGFASLIEGDGESVEGESEDSVSGDGDEMDIAGETTDDVIGELLAEAGY